MSAPSRVAAIDIGTVTTRMLVADVSEGAVVEVERSTDITHLGAGLTQTGRLADDSMRRVADVISRYASRMDELGVEGFMAMATSASRDAANGDEFAAMLGRAGVRPEIIEGSREAELAFAGATYGRTGEGFLVVDCGGGSTELIVGDAPEDSQPRIEAARSIDVGSRRMSELFLRSDPPLARELDEAREWAATELRGFFDRLDVRPREMIGLAGTATTLAAIALELDVYEPERVDGYVLTGSEVSEILGMLAELPLERRREVVGLHPERAGVIVAGTLIFETVLGLAGLQEMVVSERDILYGILFDTYRDLRKLAD